MHKYMFAIVLCLSLLLTGCSSNVHAAKAQEELVTIPEERGQQQKVIYLAEGEIPTYEQVLFIEVPNSENAAKDFLNITNKYNINVTHVTINNYGHDNYTIDCDFTNDAYDILIYVVPDTDTGIVKWYGQLKNNDSELEFWSYEEQV